MKDDTAGVAVVVRADNADIKLSPGGVISRHCHGSARIILNRFFQSSARRQTGVLSLES
jgi:hypothetical protein